MDISEIKKVKIEGDKLDLLFKQQSEVEKIFAEIRKFRGLFTHPMDPFILVCDVEEHEGPVG